MSGVYEKVYYELLISRSFLRCNWRLLRGQNFSLVSLGFLILTQTDIYFCCYCLESIFLIFNVTFLLIASG